MASFRYRNSQEINHADELGTLKSPHPVRKPGCESWKLSFSSDEKHFAWSCGKRIVKIFAWESLLNFFSKKSNKSVDEDQSQDLQPECFQTIDCGQIVRSLVFLPPIRVPIVWKRHTNLNLLLATGLSNGRIRIWDALKGELLLELLAHKGAVTDFAFSSTAVGTPRLASTSGDKTLKVWNLEEENLLASLSGHLDGILGCAWSSDDKWIASVGSDRLTLIWDSHTFICVRKLTGHLNEVTACSFTPDSALLLTSSYDTTLTVWDHVTGEKVGSYGHLFPAPGLIYAGGANGAWVRSISVSGNGAHVGSVSEDGFIRIWNMTEGFRADPELISEAADALTCRFSPSGRYLAVGFKNGGVKFLKLSKSTWFPSLKHLCRMKIRPNVSSNEVSMLEIPKTLRKYLQYKMQ